MPKAIVNQVEIEYETIGDPESKPLLLIAGLGSQLLAWPEEVCKKFKKAGFFVIKFDNRDVGLSTKFDNAGIPDFAKISAAYARGETPDVTYTLEDMADDAIGILNDLKIEKAHVLGASMGGMIAQVIGYRHPTRVLSLTIVMSTTGNPQLTPGKPEVMMQFFAPVPSERDAYITEMVKRDSLLYGTFSFNQKQSKKYRSKEYDRCYYPAGIARQMGALAVPGNLKPKLGAISAPTLVIHGNKDPFYLVEAGKDIATSIPGAELLVIDGMGHSFPSEILSKIINAVVANSNKQ